MKKQHIALLLGLLATGWSGVSAQEDDLGTETVTVVKPYSPTVSDAFKVSDSPRLNDSIVLQKKPIDYQIFSVPVASTFTPAKGKASEVKKAKPEKLYNSYLAAGIGNFNNATLDFYTSRDLDRGDKRLDIGLTHLSSRGDIDNTPLDTDFYNSALNLGYSAKDRDFNWSADIRLQHQLYNWYGLPEEGGFDQVTIDGMDERQHYFKAEAGGAIEVEDSFFQSAELRVRRFWDAVESGENRAWFKPSFHIPISEGSFVIEPAFDYVGGTFKNASLNNTANSPEINYSHWQAGLSPKLVLLGDDYTLNLGARVVYGQDAESSDSNFYIYPNVSASYRLLEDAAIAYGGVEGELRQNSYHEFVESNPYVSPTLLIQPTDRQYDAYVGLKGQLLPNLSYNIRGSYAAENRKPLFKLNPQNNFRNDEKAYYYGNSFEIFYDDIKTLGIFGELNVDVNRNFTLGVNATINDYSTETGNPAWNLPNLQGSLFMDYQIGQQWFLGANLFYVGEREDLRSVAVQNTPPSGFPSSLVTLDGYFDANAHIGYRVTDQLSVFAKASNLANNQYARWANFNVQSLQVLGGLSYRFDL